MTRVATMGCSSCATIAIQDFKETSALGNFHNKEENENYKADPSSFKGPVEGMSVSEFYNKILYPTAQDLGRTGHYPFERMMEEITKGSLATKFIVAVLNHHQFTTDTYWREELERWGFEKMDETKNVIGSLNHIFVRSTNRPAKAPNPCSVHTK